MASRCRRRGGVVDWLAGTRRERELSELTFSGALLFGLALLCFSELACLLLSSSSVSSSSSSSISSLLDLSGKS